MCNHNDVKRYYKYATDTTVRPSDLETKPPRIKKQPKFVVMQFPDIARYCTIEEEQEAHLEAIIPHGDFPPVQIPVPNDHSQVS